MQASDFAETPIEEVLDKSETTTTTDDNADNDDGDQIDTVNDELGLDITGKSLDFYTLDNVNDAVEALYMYRNVFNLIPRSLGSFVGGLKTLKFFANEINLFPDEEIGNLVELECLQLKWTSPCLSDVPLHKLKGLKELELCKVPPRPSAFKLLREIEGLKCLTKLSVCYFSIRYLPPEIGCLTSLEHLDLSFNKMKSLPSEIGDLKALISLKIANNKLSELPSSLSSLQRLENLDLSNNRLTSLGPVELSLMHSLQNLNLQHNKHLNCCQVPSWICCNLEGTEDVTVAEDVNCCVEMDVLECDIHETRRHYSCKKNNTGTPNTSAGLATGSSSSSSSRCNAASKIGKRWKRRYYLQQRARQERLNSSRKLRFESSSQSPKNLAESSNSGKEDVLAAETLTENESEVVGLPNDSKQLPDGEADCKDLPNNLEEEKLSVKKGYHEEDCSSIVLDHVSIGREDKNECCEDDALLSVSNATVEQAETSSSKVSESTVKVKRHSDKALENPKPCKYRKPSENPTSLSRKYSTTSFCGIEDHIPDGFYDAGRDRPFMSLTSYEQTLHPHSREVILMDRERDEELDGIALSAQAFVFNMKKLANSNYAGNKTGVDSLQIASLLALFVSDHFGGSDKSNALERTRKAVSGSNYRKPFVCTCTTGNRENNIKPGKPISGTTEDIVFNDICERSLQSIKLRQNSVIVPIGSLHFGVCRHRALLMKYLCDRMEPQIPCELVRGYLDSMPHAWNVVPIKRGNRLIRMVVDACCPHDIREETDQEYFCRYIPLTRMNIQISTQTDTCSSSSFPSLSTCDKIERSVSSSLLHCKIGSIEAAAKVRSLEVYETSMDEIKKFEYSCVGEVRMLGALKHPCIVEIYGHQISSKWVPSSDGNPDHRVVESTILLEYINGGSLKKYIEKLSEAGEKHVSVELALCIARDMAWALTELHSKHIIHRDVKSENVLIDLNRKKPDGSPVVKLCDFDRAVPLRSYLHTCSISHVGIHPPDACVGTPRWMAPEVLHSMHERKLYGLEVDIWSYGCLLYELLTLQIPYLGLPESNILDLLQKGERPQLTQDIEELIVSSNEPDTQILKFLIEIFHQCTERNPTDRPTADNIYERLLTQHSKHSTYISPKSFKESEAS